MLHRLIILTLSLFAVLPSTATLFGKKPEFLPPEQAFAFSVQQNGEHLQLHWAIADGYYLYKKELAVTPLAEPLNFPPSERHHDEFFGEVEIFREQLRLDVPLPQTDQQIEVRYQGCTKGFCYPPESLTLDIATFGSVQAVGFEPNLASSAVDLPQAEAQAFSPFWFLLLGFGLAFTPCVLPMLPLLSAIVLGREQPSMARALWLSVAYVQGMALTYTLLGLAVAALGLPFQIALQSPPVLIGLSLLFGLLAFSMFGLFELRLPHALQQKLENLSRRQQSGAFGGVFVMGAIAGLVASPCTTAPLSGVLLYVAQSGDLWLGGLSLYLLALGMGLPLLLVTLFGQRILPKSGEWLLKVKTLFGFVMLAVPVFLLTRVWPEFEPLMWSALAIALLVWGYEQFGGQGAWQRLARVLLLLLLVLTAKPFSDLIWQESRPVTHQLTFTRIQSLAELETQLAANRGKTAMLDLYADWCVACKEFEQQTFSDPTVQAKLSEMLLLQVDLSQNSAQKSELLRHFQVLGLPTILFFDPNGQEIPAKRLSGFIEPKPFLAWLEQ